jgi:hypothetical protein
MDANTINIPDVSIETLPPISLIELLGADRLAQVKAEMRRMQRMTPAERVAAMYRGELRGPALRAWATTRPHELPLTSLHTGTDERGEEILCSQGELPWILRHTPEYCGD